LESFGAADQENPSLCEGNKGKNGKSLAFWPDHVVGGGFTGGGLIKIRAKVGLISKVFREEKDKLSWDGKGN